MATRRGEGLCGASQTTDTLLHFSDPPCLGESIRQRMEALSRQESATAITQRGPGAADLIAQIHVPVFKRETHVKMEMSELGPTVSFHLQNRGSPLLSCGPGCRKAKVSLKWRRGGVGCWSSLCSDQSVLTLIDPWRMWHLIMKRRLLGSPGQNLVWQEGT